MCVCSDRNYFCCDDPVWNGGLFVFDRREIFLVWLLKSTGIILTTINGSRTTPVSFTWEPWSSRYVFLLKVTQHSQRMIYSILNEVAINCVQIKLWSSAVMRALSKTLWQPVYFPLAHLTHNLEGRDSLAFCVNPRRRSERRSSVVSYSQMHLTAFLPCWLTEK